MDSRKIPLRCVLVLSLNAGGKLCGPRYIAIICTFSKIYCWGQEHGENCPKITPFEIATLVRQPRNPEYDGALPRALSQLWADISGVAVGKADHRHRTDRLGSVALQPPPSRARQARA